MKRTSVWLDEQQIKTLKRIAKQKGSLQVSQCIRMAIAEFIKREEANQ
jgi:metal-responsive CopG/Arc/MetJ family transcriptional regulator